jgi:uncharacterized protein YegP (UPF0339 family)
MSGKIEYWQGRDGRWYFHKRARNGKVVDASQGYANAGNARRAARRLHPSAPLTRV